ncbi:protein of unknown function [Chryseobacterium sp. JV274]|nr:protein of unknown function [Chryseobacterium sp. JV274]
MHLSGEGICGVSKIGALKVVWNSATWFRLSILSMNFFISHKDRKGFVKCEMYKSKIWNPKMQTIQCFYFIPVN